MHAAQLDHNTPNPSPEGAETKKHLLIGRSRRVVLRAAAESLAAAAVQHPWPATRSPRRGGRAGQGQAGGRGRRALSRERDPTTLGASHDAPNLAGGEARRHPHVHSRRYATREREGTAA
jgi:hypothetical protein